jgi:hypothetical protein
VRIARLLLIAVLAAALLAVPALAAEKVPAKGKYHTDVHIQMSGGKTGPIHAWDPIMVSLRGRGHTGERYDLCMTPAPLEHARCYTNRRVNGPGVSTEPSKAGKLKLRWKLSTGKVITRTVHVKR